MLRRIQRSASRRGKDQRPSILVIVTFQEAAANSAARNVESQSVRLIGSVLTVPRSRWNRSHITDRDGLLSSASTRLRSGRRRRRCLLVVSVVEGECLL